MQCALSTYTQIAYTNVQEAIDQGLTSAKKDLYETAIRVRDSLTNATTTIGASPIGRAATSVANFVRHNWEPLIAYVIAWGIIISCTGLMYGFTAVSLPLTIGLGCGIGFGIIAGILMIKLFNLSERRSLWNLLNGWLGGLDSNGTRQIVLAVAVTVLMAAAVVFPYVMGAVFGIFIGNQLAVRVCTGTNLGRDPHEDSIEKEGLKNKIEAQAKEIAFIKEHCQGQLTDAIKGRLETIEKELESMKTLVDIVYPDKETPLVEHNE